MPEFLKKKLQQEYPNNDHAVYGTLNALGAMHGNKETAKGKAMDRKHASDMKKAGGQHPHKNLGKYLHKKKAR